jgi:hypothetical protein
MPDTTAAAQSETGECPITGTVECDCPPARPEFPDGAAVYLGDTSWPLVTVRFPDGGQVDYRVGSAYGAAHVRYSGLEIKGHKQRYDADAMVNPDGTLATIPERIGWKTGVNGVDGADQIPAKVTEHLAALVRRRARQARDACKAASGGRRPERLHEVILPDGGIYVAPSVKGRPGLRAFPPAEAARIAVEVDGTAREAVGWL